MRVKIVPWAAAPSAGAGQRDVKWAEGLRGIASLLVVTSHLTRAFAPTFLAPAEDSQHTGSIFHLPFLRLPAQGPPWVALFFLLTGYVNAMKPLRQARSGSVNSALSGLASSTLRRTGRLVFPTTIATLCSWFIAQLGGYRIGKICEATWIRDTCPNRTPGIIAPLQSLVYNCFTTWSSGSNVYDPIQWTLPFLLRGSMLVYLTLLATVRTQPRWRMLVFMGMYAFSWAGRDPMTGLNIYLGATLADFSPQISSSSHTQTPNILVRLIPWILLLLGLHLSGYPEKSPEWTSWSQQLASIGHWIFPTGAEYWRFWPSIGAQLMTVAALLSPSLQKFLSHPALIWLGSLSFPLYLLHGPLIRSVLSWMLFGWRNPIYYYTKNFDGSVASTWERIPFPDNWVFCIALPAFFFVLLASAHFWTLLVEPRCAKITKLMEEVMYGESELSMEKTLRARSDSLLNGRSRSGSLLNGHSGNNSVMSSV